MTITKQLAAIAVASLALSACGTTGVKFAQPQGVGPILGEIVEEEKVGPILGEIVNPEASPTVETAGDVQAQAGATNASLDRLAAKQKEKAEKRKLEMRKREKERLEEEAAKAKSRPIGG